MVILAQLVEHVQKGTMWFWGSVSTLNFEWSQVIASTKYLRIKVATENSIQS